MDNNLDIDIKNADAMGISYGKYKALSYDPDAKVVRKRPMKRCAICGNEVIPPRLKYCSDECGKVHDYAVRREKYHSEIKQYDREEDVNG